VKALREHLKQKRVAREYNKYLNKGSNRGVGLAPVSEVMQADTMAKEFESTVSFGMTFIVSLAGGAFMGYFLGQYAFGLSYEMCMLMAGLCAYLTIILEVSLFMIKGYKLDSMVSKEKKKEATWKEQTFGFKET